MPFEVSLTGTEVRFFCVFFFFWGGGGFGGGRGVVLEAGAR